MDTMIEARPFGIWGRKASAIDMYDPRTGRTALYDAVAANDLVLAPKLLAAGAWADARTISDDTPLCTARSPEMAGILISHCANVHAVTSGKWTPLHHAACAGVAGVVDLLLSRHASVNARAFDGRTPLHLAANREIAAMLIAAKANVHLIADDGESVFSNPAVCEVCVHAGLHTAARPAFVARKDVRGNI